MKAEMNKLKSNLDPTKDVQILNRLASSEIQIISHKTSEPQSSQPNSKAIKSNSSITIHQINQTSLPRGQSKLKLTRLPAPESESSCDEAD